MKQYAHLPLLAALLGVVGVGACTDPLAEDVWWLCESHSDCGVGEACFDGLCKPRSYGLTGPDLGLDGQADASQDEDTAAAPADLPPEQDLAGQDPDLAPEADPAEDDVDALDDAEEVAEPDPDPSADVEETPDAEDPADALVAEVDPEPDADVELSEALAEPESEPEPEPEPEPGPEPEPDTGPEPEPDTGPEPEPDTGPEPEPDQGPDVAPELDTGPDLPVGPPVALVVGDLALDPGSHVINQRLQILGFEVVTEGAEEDLDLIVMGTGATFDEGSLWAEAAVPLLVWEPEVYAVLGVTTGAGGIGTGSQLFVKADGHPALAGASGKVAVLATDGAFTQAEPSGEGLALGVADKGNGPTIMAVWDEGQALAGLLAPARRATFFLGPGSESLLTAEGWAIFDATVGWLAP